MPVEAEPSSSSEMPRAEPSRAKMADAARLAPPPPEPIPISARRQWANYLFFMPMVGIVTASFGTIALICALWDKDGSQQHRIARWWGIVMLRLAFAPVTVEHPEHLPGRAPAVYAANHLSYFDTPLVFAKLPFQFRILAKAPLWKLPFVGWYLERSGQVPIDQTSARAGVVSLARGVATVKGGMPMVIFPEGGRAYNGQLQPMLAGAAFIAIKAQAPLIPLTLVGTYELLPIHIYALRPRPLKLIVGEPISTVGMTTKDADALTQRLFAVIHETYVAAHDDTRGS